MTLRQPAYGIRPSQLRPVGTRPSDQGPRTGTSHAPMAARASFCLLFWLALSPCWAASQVSVAFDENDILAWGGGTDTAPRGLEVLSDGRLVYFEDSNTLNSANRDAIVLFDPSKTGAARFSVIASKNQMKALATKYNHANLTIGDLVRDADNNIYAIATEYNADRSESDNFVLVVPFNGVGFDAPTYVVDVPDGGLKSTSTTRHRVAVAGAQLFVLFDDLTSTNNGGAFGANGVYRCVLNGAPAQLQLWTSYQAIGQVSSTQLQANQAFGLWQVRADAAGNLYALVYLNGTAKTGDLIRIDTNGTPSLLLSALQAESETGWLNAFGTTTSLAVDPVSAHLYLFETGTNNTEKELLYEFDEDGRFIRQIAAGPQILKAAPQITSLTTLESNALALGADGRLYAFLSNESRETAITIDPDGGAYILPDFIWPNGDETYLDVASPFGPRQLTSENFRYDFHRGIDMTMPINTKIYAVADGVVVSRTSKTVNDCNGIAHTEYTLGIRHGNAPPYVYSFYLHLESTVVNVGDVVSQGRSDLSPTNHIGLSGSKSESCYAHLHFETRVGSTQESTAVNPLTYLPYSDGLPDAPSLQGANGDATQRLYYAEFSAPDEEMDLSAIQVTWQGTPRIWDWPVANKANGGTYDTRMDHPVVDFGNGIFGATFPEHVNQSASAANYGFVIAGLDASAQSTGLLEIADVQGTTNQLTLPLTQSGLQMSPVADRMTAAAGTTVTFNVTLSNGTSQSQTIALSAVSARANTVYLASADQSFTLAPSQSRQVLIAVDLPANAPYGVGDAVLVSADSGSGPLTMSLFAIEQNP